MWTLRIVPGQAGTPASLAELLISAVANDE
jgi:hypothetical protein